MFANLHKSGRLLVSAALVGSGLGLFAAFSPATTAHADPAFANTNSTNGKIYVGVGADTLQDLFNAYSGAEPSPGTEPTGIPTLAPVGYPTLESPLADTSFGGQPVVSFDTSRPPYSRPHPQQRRRPDDRQQDQRPALRPAQRRRRRAHRPL